MDDALEHDWREFRKHGSPRSMARVFDRVAPELLLVAGHLARNADAAEDLIQGTLLTAIEQRERFDDRRRLMPWLLGILVRLHRRERSRRRLVAIPEDVPSGEEGPLVEARSNELAERLEQMLAALPDAYREPLRLRLAHGMEPVQIARVLGRPLETIRTQLRRGRERLRETLPRGFSAVITAGLSREAPRLAAARDAVLAHAALLQPSTTSGPAAVLAALLMKKSLVATLVLAVLGTAGFLLLGGSGPRAVPSLPAGTESIAPPGRDPSAVLDQGVARSETRMQPAPGTPAPTVVLGRVEWEADGEPASDVRVRLVAESQSDLAPDVWQTSDVEGQVRFEVGSAGRVALIADRGGSVELEPRMGRVNEVALRLPTGVLVCGRVLDHESRPVEGAEVLISREPYRQARCSVGAKSGEDGRFVLRSVEPARLLTARLPGYFQADLALVDGAPGDEIEIELRLGRACPHLRGVVRGPGGGLARGALVVVGETVRIRYGVEDGRRIPRTAPPPCWVHTDANGEFVCDSPRADSVDLWAGAPGAAIYYARVPLDPGGTRIEIDLAAEAVAVGRVIDRAGEPVPGAGVRADVAGIDTLVERGPLWARPTCATDELGAFELRALAAGPTTFVAQAAELGNARASMALVAGTTTSVELVLGCAPAIVGRVVDEDGAPLEGLEVHATARTNLPVGGRAQGITGERGSFSLEDCFHERYTLVVRDPRSKVNPSVTVEDVVPGAGPVTIVFPMSELASATLVGRLLAPDGSPLDAERATLSRLAPNGTLQWGSTVVLEAGAFRASGLPAGRHQLLVSSGESGSWLVGTFALAAGETLDVGDVVAPAPGRIELTLEGEFPDEVEATIAPEGREGGMRTVVRRGHALSEPLAPGPYWVGFLGVAAPLGSERVEVRAGETTSSSLLVGPSVKRRVRYPRVLENQTFLTMRWEHLERDRVVGEWSWGVWRHEADEAYEWLLYPGTYRVTVTNLLGASAERTFCVSEELASDEILDLPSPGVDRRPGSRR